MHKTAYEVLEEAKAIIQGGGWCQGTLTNGTACCALGAINLAASGNAQSMLGSGVARSILRSAIGEPLGSIGDWNDDADRDEAQVLEAFSNAILIAEREGL